MIDEMINGFKKDLADLQAGEEFLYKERDELVRQLQDVNDKIELNAAKQRMIRTFMER